MGAGTDESLGRWHVRWRTCPDLTVIGIGNQTPKPADEVSWIQKNDKTILYYYDKK
jgi:hypothetical protein